MWQSFGRKVHLQVDLVGRVGSVVWLQKDPSSALRIDRQSVAVAVAAAVGCRRLENCEKRSDKDILSTHALRFVVAVVVGQTGLYQSCL